jgi:hypothetical protein
LLVRCLVSIARITACLGATWLILSRLPTRPLLARPRSIDCSHGDPGDGGSP